MVGFPALALGLGAETTFSARGVLIQAWFFSLPLISHGDGQGTMHESYFPQPLGKRSEIEVPLLKDFRIRAKVNSGAGAISTRFNLLQIAVRGTPDKALPIEVTVTTDLHDKPL